jgi:uncharacterized phage protein (TIGR01671 family)
MRDIKFRAWIKDQKRMERCIDVNPFFIGDCDRFHWMREDVELMQYTGSKDDDGIEIYEGDILKCLDCEDEEYIVVVRFDGGAFIIEVNGCDYDYTAIGWAIGHDINECHVIGNIYENPERLKS